MSSLLCLVSQQIDQWLQIIELGITSEVDQLLTQISNELIIFGTSVARELDCGCLAMNRLSALLDKVDLDRWWDRLWNRQPYNVV